MIGKRSVNELQVTGSNPLQVIKYVLQFTWYDPIAWFQVLPDLSSSRADISWRAGQLKTELAGCVIYSATPQAFLAVSDEACWPNMAEASLSCCQFSSIHLVSKDSEHTVPSLGPHNSYRQHFAAQILTLTMDKAQTSVAVSFIFCATFVVPFCQTFSQI